MNAAEAGRCFHRAEDQRRAIQAGVVELGLRMLPQLPGTSCIEFAAEGGGAARVAVMLRLSGLV
jgi:hypothetical protein